MLETMQKQRQKRISIWVMLVFACLAVAACVSLPLLMPAPMAVFQTSGLEAGAVVVETLQLSEKIPEPSGLAFHPTRKTLFVTSRNSDQRWIYEVEPQTGKVTKWKSGGEILPSSIYTPCKENGLTSGNCFVIDGTWIDNVPSILIDSKAQIYIALPYSQSGLFSGPNKKEGQIYQINLVSPDSIENPILSRIPLNEVARFKDPPTALVLPHGFITDKKGVMYVVDGANHLIRKIEQGFISNLAGSLSAPDSLEPTYRDGTNNFAKFASPFGIAQDSFQSIYVTERSFGSIRKISPEGTVTTFAGSQSLDALQKLRSTGIVHRDGDAKNAVFGYITGILIDKQDNFYIADTGNHVIRKMSPTGVTTTLAGSLPSSWKDKQTSSASAQGPHLLDGPGNLSRFYLPEGLALDDQGMLYVADRGNHAIRRIKPIGEQR